MSEREIMQRIFGTIAAALGRPFRIEHETFSGKRNVDELVAELKQLEKPGSEVRGG